MKCLLGAFFILGSVCISFCDGRPEECELGPQPPRPPFCFNHNETYTYDNVTNVCIVIPEYGCPGYPNVFATEAECISTCVEADTKTSVEVAEILNRQVLQKEPRIVNGVMDMVFSWVGSLLKRLGKDPVPIPDLTTDAIPNLEIGFIKGSLAGFSNLVREGDWHFGANGLTKFTVHGGIAVNNITMSYALVAKLFGYGGEAGVAASIAHFGITFDFELDAIGCTVTMKDFTLANIAHIDIDIDVVSFLNPVIESITEYLSNALMETFRSTVEKTVVETVGVINVCHMVKDLIG